MSGTNLDVSYVACVVIVVRILFLNFFAILLFVFVRGRGKGLVFRSFCSFPFSIDLYKRNPMLCLQLFTLNPSEDYILTVEQ